MVIKVPRKRFCENVETSSVSLTVSLAFSMLSSNPLTFVKSLVTLIPGTRNSEVGHSTQLEDEHEPESIIVSVRLMDYCLSRTSLLS